MATAESPRLHIGAWTAFKAGFFGMVGVIVANLILGGVALIFVGVMGIGLAGAVSRFSSPTASGTTNSSPTITMTPAKPSSRSGR